MFKYNNDCSTSTFNQQGSQEQSRELEAADREHTEFTTARLHLDRDCPANK